jgi:hypothetical protein
MALEGYQGVEAEEEFNMLGFMFEGEEDKEPEERKEEDPKQEVNIADLIPQLANKKTCAKCIKNQGQKWCDKHGGDYIDHKCIYCCAVALYNCGGENYFCQYHHHDGKGTPEYEEKKRGMGGQCN